MDEIMDPKMNDGIRIGMIFSLSLFLLIHFASEFLKSDCVDLQEDPICYERNK